MKLTKFTLPEDGGVRGLALHPSGLLARLGSQVLVLDTTVKKPSPLELVLPEVAGAAPHLPPLARTAITGGFVGEHLVVLSSAVEQAGYPAQPAMVHRFDRAGQQVSSFEVPGAEWLWVDAQQRLIVHGGGKSTARDAEGQVLAELGPSFAVPSPDGRHVARKVGEQIEISGAHARTVEGTSLAWIDAHHLAFRAPLDVAEVQRLDVRTGAVTSLGAAPSPSGGFFADANAVWVVRKGGTAAAKVATVHRLPVDGSGPEQLEIPGGKSEARACLADGRLAVAVNWQKAVFLVDA